MYTIMIKFLSLVLSSIFIVLISSCNSAEYDRIASEQVLISDSIEGYKKLISNETEIRLKNSATKDFDTSQTVAIPIRPTEIYYVKKGYPICWSREDLKKMTTYISRKDYDAIDELLLSDKCVSAGGGAEFFVEKKVGGLPSIVQIHFEISQDPISAWTVREALEKK